MLASIKHCEKCGCEHVVTDGPCPSMTDELLLTDEEISECQATIEPPYGSSVTVANVPMLLAKVQKHYENQIDDLKSQVVNAQEHELNMRSVLSAEGWKSPTEWEQLKAERDALYGKQKGEVWYWQKEDNHLESLSCPILIEAEDLRAIEQAVHQARIDTARKIFEEVEPEIYKLADTDNQRAWFKTLKARYLTPAKPQELEPKPRFDDVLEKCHPDAKSLYICPKAGVCKTGCCYKRPHIHTTGSCVPYANNFIPEMCGAGPCVPYSEVDNQEFLNNVAHCEDD